MAFLRRLRMEAPGTYSHCLQLGALCEAAAEAIAVICATALPAWLFQLSSAAPKVWKAEPELSSAASKR